jgi:hypothetical protein
MTVVITVSGIQQPRERTMRAKQRVAGPIAAVPEIDEDVIKARERRAAERKVISLRAQVELPNGTVLTGHSTDISSTGIGLFAPSRLRADQECRVTIDLSACGTRAELNLVGRVCYCTETRDRYRIGMRFVGLDNKAAELLSSLLR